MLFLFLVIIVKIVLVKEIERVSFINRLLRGKYDNIVQYNRDNNVTAVTLNTVSLSFYFL